MNPFYLTDTEKIFYEEKIDELITRKVQEFAEIIENIFEWRKMATRAAPIPEWISKVFIEANYYNDAGLTPLEIKPFIRNKRFRDYVISLCP